MSTLEITCPNCNETFTADQALQNHLKSKEKEYKTPNVKKSEEKLNKDLQQQKKKKKR